MKGFKNSGVVKPHSGKKEHVLSILQAKTVLIWTACGFKLSMFINFYLEKILFGFEAKIKPQVYLNIGLMDG